MLYLIACTLIASGLIALWLLSYRYPRIRCEIAGHEPKCSIVGYDLRWHCENCGRQVVL